MAIVKRIEGTVKTLNERQTHQQATSRLDEANRDDQRKERQRQALKDKLEEEVFPINRITKANYVLFQSKGFQRAVAEIVASQLFSFENSALRSQFNTVLFETMFTRRLFSFFYIGSSG